MLNCKLSHAITRHCLVALSQTGACTCKSIWICTLHCAASMHHDPYTLVSVEAFASCLAGLVKQQHCWLISNDLLGCVRHLLVVESSRS